MKLRDVNVNRSYELEDNAEEGFKEAIATNRLLLALQYLEVIFKEHSDARRALEAELRDLSNRVDALTAKAPAKKATTTEASE